MHTRLAQHFAVAACTALLAAALPGQYTGSGAPRVTTGGAGEEPPCVSGTATAGAEQLRIVRPDADADLVELNHYPANQQMAATMADPVLPSADGSTVMMDGSLRYEFRMPTAASYSATPFPISLVYRTWTDPVHNAGSAMVGFHGSLHLTAVDCVDDDEAGLRWITGSGDVNVCQPVAEPQPELNEAWYEVAGHYALSRFRRYTNALSQEVLERYRSDGAVMRYEKIGDRWRPDTFFDSYDNAWQYHWLPNGRLAKIVDPRGVEVRFGWSASGCNVTYVRGGTTFSDWSWSFQMSAAGRLIALTLPQTIYYDIAATGPLVDTATPTSDARTLTFSYHSGGASDGLLNLITDSRLSAGGSAYVVRSHSHQTRLGAVRLTEQTDELGMVHSFGYSQNATHVVVDYTAAETTAGATDPTTMTFAMPASVLTNWTTSWLPVEITVTPGALGKPRAAISGSPKAAVAPPA